MILSPLNLGLRYLFLCKSGLNAIIGQVVIQMQTNMHNMISGKNVHIHIKGLFWLKMWTCLQGLNGRQGRRQLNIMTRTTSGVSGYIFGLVYRSKFFSV